jgi:competence protein ComEA
MIRICSTALVIVAMLSGSALAQKASSSGEASATKAAVVNINTATVAELESLPGIGAKVAARIVDYRTKKGPFKKVEELMNVQGIGEKSFLKIRGQLTVSGSPAAAQQ